MCHAREKHIMDKNAAKVTTGGVPLCLLRGNLLDGTLTQQFERIKYVSYEVRSSIKVHPGGSPWDVYRVL